MLTGGPPEPDVLPPPELVAPDPLDVEPPLDPEDDGGCALQWATVHTICAGWGISPGTAGLSVQATVPLERTGSVVWTFPVASTVTRQSALDW